MFVHGNNLEQKENHNKKYQDSNSRKYLAEIRVRYDQWKFANEKLVGPIAAVSKSDPEVLGKRVRLLNEYKDFLDQKHYAEHLILAQIFTHQSLRNLCSTYSVTWCVIYRRMR